VSDQESGFEIKHPEADKGTFYAWPSSFRLGDTVLVEKLTGLEWPEFAARIPDEGDEVPDVTEADDLVIYVGLMGVSIWQHHRQWRRDKVIQYVERLDLERIVFIGGTEGPETGEERPPDLTADGENSSETSPPLSPAPADSTSDEPNQTSSGEPTSPTTST
jgi:hypothetical protein